jgi:hypothetical protein
MANFSVANDISNVIFGELRNAFVGKSYDRSSYWSNNLLED